MPRARSLLIFGCLFGVIPAVCQENQELRLLFTGDILLSRQVQREIEQTGRFPWLPFANLFHNATWVAGNLEGAVGNARDCIPGDANSPCFNIPPSLVPLLSKVGFHALGIANNHASDLLTPA